MQTESAISHPRKEPVRKRASLEAPDPVPKHSEEGFAVRCRRLAAAIRIWPLAYPPRSSQRGTRGAEADVPADPNDRFEYQQKLNAIQTEAAKRQFQIANALLECDLSFSLPVELTKLDTGGLKVGPIAGDAATLTRLSAALNSLARVADATIAPTKNVSQTETPIKEEDLSEKQKGVLICFFERGGIPAKREEIRNETHPKIGKNNKTEIEELIELGALYQVKDNRLKPSSFALALGEKLKPARRKIAQNSRRRDRTGK
jgi:hypothetical protein